MNTLPAEFPRLVQSTTTFWSSSLVPFQRFINVRYGVVRMQHQLRYGESAVVAVELAPEALVANCRRGTEEIIEDLSPVVSAALQNPLGYPPLADTVVPGDRITIALDPDVPQPAALVAGLLDTCRMVGVDLANVTVLLSSEAGEAGSWAADLAALGTPVRIELHAAHDPTQLAYLAASKDAHPILLNRCLCDADLVLPVNLLRPETALGYAGPHGGMVASFSDAATQDRFRMPHSAMARKEQKRRRAEADEVAWLLGIQLTLQIVAGSGNSVLHVLAGQADAAYRRGRSLVDAAWSFQVPRKAQLVVATIEGSQDDQSWANFGRALHAAQQVCAHDGTIVLCTELSGALGPSLQRLAGYRADRNLLHQVRHDRSEDAVSASLLLELRDTVHVFLLSCLDEASVESLGIGYIDAPEHVVRLSRNCDSCILLPNAHRAVVRADERGT